MTEWGYSTPSQELIRQINEEFKLKQGRSPSLALQLDCSLTHKELKIKTFKITLNERKRRFKRKFGVQCFAQGHCSNHSGAKPKYFPVDANATITTTKIFSTFVYCQTTAEVLGIH